MASEKQMIEQHGYFDSQVGFLQLPSDFCYAAIFATSSNVLEREGARRGIQSRLNQLDNFR